MHNFGEMCITTYKDNTHAAKLANCGTPSIWVGFTENHLAGTYQIFNPKTKKIILTWDVTFLQKSYGEYTKVDKPVVVTTSYEGSDEEEELETVHIVTNNSNVNVVSDSDSDSSEEDFENNNDNFFDKYINDQMKVTLQTTINIKVVQAMKKLQALYNVNVNKIVKQGTKEKSAIENLNFLIDLAMVTTDTKPVTEEPKTFVKAWNHPNANSHAKWREVIKKEFADMIKQQVWHKTSKSLMPPNQRCVKNKWVFKIKCNSVYQVCLSCMYSQVPGIDFCENYSPVVNDITFCILLLMVLHFGYLAKIVDMETAFLYRDLKEEIYVECPQGMSDIKMDDCVILNKHIYGLVQAAQQNYMKAVEILKSSSFVGGSIHPCLHVKKSVKGIVFVALYKDNN